MHTNNMSQKVAQNIQSIKDLNDQYYKERYALELAHNKKIKEHEDFLYELENQYKELAWDMAIEAHECPKSRWGQPLEPTDVNVTTEGIVLTWEEEHPYHASNYQYFTVSWEQLFQGEQNADQ